MSERLSRHELKTDEVRSFLDHVMHWLVDNSKNLMIGGAGFVVVVMVVMGIGEMRDQRNAEATEALATAMKALADNGADDAAVGPLFQAVIDEHPSTPSGDIARLYMQRFAADQGQLDPAALELLAGDGDEIVERIAFLDYITALREADRHDEAAERLQRIVDGKADGLPADVALFELAKTKSQQGESDVAKGLFEQVRDDFPESTYRYMADQELSSLG